MCPCLGQLPRIDMNNGMELNAAMFSYATRDVVCLNTFASSERRMSLTLGSAGTVVDEDDRQGKRYG